MESGNRERPAKNEDSFVPTPALQVVGEGREKRLLGTRQM